MDKTALALVRALAKTRPVVWMGSIAVANAVRETFPEDAVAISDFEIYAAHVRMVEEDRAELATVDDREYGDAA